MIALLTLSIGVAIAVELAVLINNIIVSPKDSNDGHLYLDANYSTALQAEAIPTLQIKNEQAPTSPATHMLSNNPLHTPSNPPSPTIRPTSTPMPYIFKDRVVEAAIREELGIHNQPVFTDDLLRITSLTIIDSNVSNVEDIGNLLNLTSLYLNNNNQPDCLQDVTPLCHLRKLESLTLTGHAIIDISPIGLLANLAYLDLSNNAITDISPLKGLSRLNYLDLSRNNITRIDSIESLTSITVLYLSENNIYDITPLYCVIRLTDLSLDNNDIDNIWPLSDMEQLRCLYLENNRIYDISPLAELWNLEDIYLYNNPLNGIDPIEHLNANIHW